MNHSGRQCQLHRRRQYQLHRPTNPIPYRCNYFGETVHIDQNEKLELLMFVVLMG